MKVDEAVQAALNAGPTKHAGRNDPETRAAFLASLRANGYAVVPVKATEKMHHAARDWSIKKYGQGVGRDGSEGCWNAMLAAAQENDDGR